jgi:hypothetical protein
MAKVKIRDEDRFKELAARAWLLADDDYAQVEAAHRDGRATELLASLLDYEGEHPFSRMTPREIEEPHVHLLRLMRDPEYFPFTCKLLFGVNIFPFQHVILKELWHRPFPMLVGSRGLGKSFILALYILLRMMFTQGSRIVVVGASFRQAKVVFENCEQLWTNGHIYRDIVGSGKGRAGRDQGPRKDVDRWELVVGESMCVSIPLGTGEKIRGQRASILINDEMSATPEAIFDNVVQGFSAVSSDPFAAAKDRSRSKLLTSLGMADGSLPAVKHTGLRSNQTVLAGTAYFSFGHFAKRWKRYVAIIRSKGDPKVLRELFGGPPPDGFDWRDYSVMRIPFEKVPSGFMDDKTMAQARLTVKTSIFKIEYNACFLGDSDGFFRRSLIESCVTGQADRPIVLPSGEVSFHLGLVGDPKARHVIAIDPASESDNFTIFVLAMYPDHRRVVYGWSTTRKTHKQRLAKGLVDEHDFYAYCARKTRDLMKRFPNVAGVALDMGGGGVAVEEALANPALLGPDEMPIYPFKDPPEEKNPKPTDEKPGHHILEKVQFASADYTSKANHGLKFDLESKVLLFPYFDPASLAVAVEEDKAQGRIVMDGEEEVRLYDSLDDCIQEVEQLKEELSTIVVTTTPSGREHFDTPKAADAGKSGKLRKDRYSAVLMANALARKLATAEPAQHYQTAGGGFAQGLARPQDAKKERGPAPLYSGPDWWVQGVNAQGLNYGAAVRR